MTKTRKILFAATAVVLTGAMALMAAPPPRRGGGPGAGPMMFGRALDLTDAQKEQAKAIFEETRKANETYREQLRSLRAEEREAIKAGKSENELRNLAQRSANVTADMHANRLVAQSKFWQILTPEQRAKLEERGEKMRERMREGKGRFGRGFRAQ